jgi:hypothetical protein
MTGSAPRCSGVNSSGAPRRASNRAESSHCERTPGRGFDALRLCSTSIVAPRRASSHLDEHRRTSTSIPGRAASSFAALRRASSRFEQSRIKLARAFRPRSVELSNRAESSPASALPARRVELRRASSSFVELRRASSSFVELPTETNQAPASVFRPRSVAVRRASTRFVAPRRASSRLDAPRRASSRFGPPRRAANVVGTACAGCWRRFGPRRRNSSTCAIPSTWVLLGIRVRARRLRHVARRAARECVSFPASATLRRRHGSRHIFLALDQPAALGAVLPRVRRFRAGGTRKAAILSAPLHPCARLV